MNQDIKKIKDSIDEKLFAHSIKIKDKTYTIDLLPATQAFGVATQIAIICLPALGAYADSVKKESLVLPEENNLYTEMAMLLVGEIHKTSVMDIVTVLTQNVKRNNEVIRIDEEFKGNLSGLLILLEFILKENCGDFFTDYLKEKGISLQFLQKPQQQAETT